MKSRLKIVRFDVLPRLVAALFALVLVNLFRFTIDNTHIFLAQPVGLTSFAFFISFFLWGSFFYYHHLGNNETFHSKRIFLISLLNISLFIFFNEDPETKYSLAYPLCFLVQVILNFYLLGSRFYNFLQYRMAVAIGALPGLFYIEFFLSIWFLFPASLLLINLPYRKFFSLSRQKVQSTTRMLPFRLRLDFCRYLFLVTALWSILDGKREDFPFIFSFLLLGSLIQFLVLRLHKKKEHIRPGLRVLAFILFLLAPSLLVFPINMVSAVAYISLTIWESVYFGKIIEGTLKREQIIAGVLLGFGIFANLIQAEHMILVTTCLLTIAQLRILVYLYKDLRHFISILMVLSISSWIAVTYVKLKESEGVAFFKPTVATINIFLSQAQLSTLDSLLKSNAVRTNALPEGFQSTCYEKPLKEFYPLEFLVPLQLRLYSTLSPKVINLFFAQKTSVYANETNLSILKQNFNKIKSENIIFLDNYSSGLDQENNSASLDCLYRELSTYFQGQRNFEAAVHYYSFLLKKDPQNPELLLKAATLSGSAGRISEQISLLESYIKLNREGMKEKQLLIELYFLNQDLEKSEALTKELLFRDKENAIFYYQWLIRIAEAQPDFFSTRKLYYSLTSWRPRSRKQEFEKNSLLQKLEQLIKLNPSFGMQFQEELNRQEFIEFPD